MKNPYTGFIFTLLILITVIIIFNTALGNHIERDKTKSQWLNENPCMIKIITTSIEEEINGQKVTTVTKEEVLKCKDYESTISITQSWPMKGVKRGTEHGIACQMPDGRWIIEAAS